jgi:hypothetical protein
MRLSSRAGLVALDDFIPFAAPDDFDDIPTRAAEKSFEFLDNFSVAANGSVEPLQITIDYPDQIIQTFARAKRDRAERFRFVRFAVADEAPDFRLFPEIKPRAFR